MDDIVIFKTILNYISSVDSSSVIEFLIFMLVGINICRILGILEIVKWAFNLINTNPKHKVNTNHSELVASLYTDIFNNHLVFNNRLSAIVSDLTELRSEIDEYGLASYDVDYKQNVNDMYTRILQLEEKISNLEHAMIAIDMSNKKLIEN